MTQLNASINILNYSVSSLMLFVIAASIFWTFLVWREGRKDGFLSNKLFDLAFLTLIGNALINYGVITYFNWHRLYRPNNFILKYNLELICVSLTILLTLLISFLLAKRWKWSSYRVMDITSVGITFFTIIVCIGAYLIYGDYLYLIISGLSIIFYLFILRFRGYLFTSGYLFSFFMLFLSLIYVLFYNKPGYLLFSLVFFTIGILNFYLRRRILMDRKSLPQELIENIKSKLLSKKERLQQEELLLKQEDPYMQTGRTEDNAEYIDEAVLEDRAKEELDNRMSLTQLVKKQVDRALTAINVGNYGKCESCGKKIDPARLEAYPETTLCLECALKEENKKENENE